MKQKIKSQQQSGTTVRPDTAGIPELNISAEVARLGAPMPVHATGAGDALAATHEAATYLSLVALKLL